MEHLFRNMLRQVNEKLTQEVEISSAGILGRECQQCLERRGMEIPVPMYGKAPNNPVIAALARRGVDISDYKSREADSLMLEGTDLILAVLKANKEEVLTVCPTAEGKVFTFNEFTGTDGLYHFDDCALDPLHLPPHLWENACDDPAFVNGFMAETEEHMAKAMPKFLAYLQRG